MKKTYLLIAFYHLFVLLFKRSVEIITKWSCSGWNS